MKHSKKIIIFERPHDLSRYLLKHFMIAVKKAIQEKGRCCVALQGGESLREFFSKLSGVQDYQFWENIHLFQTDQFHIPYNNPRHQFQFLKNNLLDYINIPAKNVHSIVTHTENAAYSVDQYAEDITRFFELPVNSIPKFDYVIMGLNETDYLGGVFEEGSSAAPIVESYDIKNLDMVSIHPRILADANHVIFVGCGENAALNACEMIEVWGKDLPTAKDDPNLNKSLVFLLDAVAANRLSKDYDHSDQEEGVVLFDKQ